MKKIILAISKIFLGRNISKKIPFIFKIYKKIIFKLIQKNKNNQNVIYKIPFNFKIILPNDYSLNLFFLIKGEYEIFQTSLFVANLKKNDIFFDIGAHVGYYSLIASKFCKKIIAFEPVKSNFELLKKNIKINKIINVKTIKTIISDKNKNKENIYLSDNESGNHSLIKEKENSQFEIVSSITLDNYCLRSNIMPNVIKIDVEGAEYKVIKGAKKILNNENLETIFIEIKNPFTAEKIIDILIKSNFFLMMIDELNKKLIELSKNKINKLINKYGYINLIAKRIS